MSNKEKKLKWYQVMGIGGFIIGWFAHAVKDGVISKEEQKDLITTLLDMAGNTDITLE